MTEPCWRYLAGSKIVHALNPKRLTSSICGLHKHGQEVSPWKVDPNGVRRKCENCVALLEFPK